MPTQRLFDSRNQRRECRWTGTVIRQWVRTKTESSVFHSETKSRLAGRVESSPSSNKRASDHTIQLDPIQRRVV